MGGVSKIIRRESRAFGNPCQHTRSNFLAIMEREHEIGSPLAR